MNKTRFLLSLLATTAALVGLLLVASCGRGDSSTPPAPPPAGLALLGYGLPNAWHQTDPTVLGDALVQAGLGLTVVEAIPWFTKRGSGCKHDGGLSDRQFASLLHAFVGAMRERGIITIVMGVNANNCKVRAEWTTAEFEALDNSIQALGPLLVWYLPINEPWAGGPILGEWNSLSRKSWTGTFLVADKGRNNATGLPFFSVPFDFVTQNACNDEAAYAGLESGLPVIVTTDCTGTLNPGPERVAGLAAAARASGAPLLIYDFWGTSPDLDVIEALS